MHWFYYNPTAAGVILWLVAFVMISRAVLNKISYLLMALGIKIYNAAQFAAILVYCFSKEYGLSRWISRHCRKFASKPWLVRVLLYAIGTIAAIRLSGIIYYSAGDLIFAVYLVAVTLACIYFWHFLPCIKAADNQ